VVQPQLMIIEHAPLTLDEEIELQRHESAMDQCRDEFMVHLSAIHKKKLYRRTGTFEEYCQQRWGYTADYARKLIRSSEVIQHLKINTKVSILPTTETQARPLTRLEPDEQPIAWQEALERSNGQPTAKIVEQVVREMRASASIEGEENDVLDPPMEPAQVADLPTAPPPMAVHFSSATPEWYTPAHIIEKARAMMGAIDLDPASSQEAQRTVQAGAWFGLDHPDETRRDGLAHEWPGLVYLNPPYGDVIGDWVHRLIHQYDMDITTEAIALLPGRIDTGWFQPLIERGFAWCIVKGRLRFSGAENSAPFPSVIMYLGEDVDRFQRFFRDLGPIVRSVE
jgi:hypothetical protein